MKPTLPKLGLLFLLFSSLSFIFSPSVAYGKVVVGSKTITFYAIADSYVNSSSPGSNYGTSKSLIVRDDCYVYLMFDFSSIPSNAIIISAKLMLYASSGHWEGPWGIASIGAHYCSDNSWTEYGITWNNRPSFNATPTGSHSFGWFEYAGWKSWDVTADVKKALGYGKLTETLKWVSGTGYMDFDSRETSEKPELSVEYSTKPIYDIVLESLQNTGMTSNLGLITLAGYTFSLPMNASVVDGSYWAAYEGGYNFVKWETTGGLSVSDAYARNTTVSFSGSGTLRAVGDAETVRYFYDDGTREDYTFERAGKMVAVRFTPSFSGKLKAIRVYISYRPQAFKIHALDTDRSDVITPIVVTPTSIGWLDIDLSGYNVNVVGGNDFYIAVEWMNDYYPELGIDDSKPDGRSWSWNGTNWETEAYDDYMIRAVVTSALPLKTLTYISCSFSSDFTDVGSGVTVSGSITPAHGGVNVALRYTKPDRSIVKRTTTTTDVGQYRDVYAPDTLGKWSVKASWIGDESHEGATSPEAQLEVIIRIQSTITDFKVSRERIKEGESIDVSGVLKPVDESVIVTLTYEKPDGTLYKENVTTKPSTGEFGFTFKPNMVGLWSVAASWAGDREYTPATSLTIKFTVEEKTFLEKYGAWIGLGGLATIIVIVAVALIRRRKEVPPRVPPSPPPMYPRPAPTPPAPPPTPPTKKYCIHCGAVIPTEAIYCPQCGGKQD